MPDTLTANQLNQAHNDFKVMSEEDQQAVKTIQLENAKHAGGKSGVLCFVPHIEVFHLNKLLVPNVQIVIQMYFNSPALWTMKYTGGVAYCWNVEDIKVKLYLCQVRLNPSVYRELLDDMSSGKKSRELPHGEKRDPDLQHPVGHQTL